MKEPKRNAKEAGEDIVIEMTGVGWGNNLRAWVYNNKNLENQKNKDNQDREKKTEKNR